VLAVKTDPKNGLLSLEVGHNRSAERPLFFKHWEPFKRPFGSVRLIRDFVASHVCRERPCIGKRCRLLVAAALQKLRQQRSVLGFGFNSFTRTRFNLSILGNMKIGFSTFVMQGGKSGVATYVRNLIRFLQLEDADNTYDLLMARDESDLVPLTHPNFEKTLSAPFVNRPVVNLAWHNLALPQKQYDLLHIPSYRRIPLVKKTKIVATVHDLAAFSVDDKYDRTRMFFNRRMVPSRIRNADHVIAVSHATKDDLVRWVGYPEDKISVIYSGIDQDLFRPLPKSEARERLSMLHGLNQPFFVYVSRLEHPAKNHIRLIEAFERFKLENDSAHQLVFAGADWHGADAVRARAAESPVKNDIIFLGFVSSKSLPLLYSGCDVMVFPSLFEGFGFPIVEALACGASVICSNTSSMKEIAGSRVPTFDPARSDEIFNALESAMAKGWSVEQRADGMEYALTFDWRKTAQKVKGVYQSVH
jgi:glycosyltransferase involved in cell wall biosynthesis